MDTALGGPLFDRSSESCAESASNGRDLSDLRAFNSISESD